MHFYQSKASTSATMHFYKKNILQIINRGTHSFAFVPMDIMFLRNIKSCTLLNYPLISWSLCPPFKINGHIINTHYNIFILLIFMPWHLISTRGIEWHETTNTFFGIVTFNLFIIISHSIIICRTQAIIAYKFLN